MNGLIERKLYNERPSRLEYHLTAKSGSHRCVFRALHHWAISTLENKLATFTRGKDGRAVYTPSTRL